MSTEPLSSSPPGFPPGQRDLPHSDGEPMETQRHVEQMTQLITTLNDAWRDRDDVYVAGNMFVHFSEIHSKRGDFRGPDVFVVLDTERNERLSWVVWEEGGRLPDVVVELLSDSTRHIDLGEKKKLYARVWRTPAYFAYDPFSHELFGWRLDAAGRDYVPLAPDARGDLEVAPLGLKLGVRDVPLTHACAGPCLRWIDVHGRPIPTSSERADEEKQRADEEKQRADEEKQRADEEKQRADEEKQRADEEKQRADALVRRVAALEARLARGER